MMFYNVTPTLQAFFIIEEGQIGCYVIVTYLNPDPTQLLNYEPVSSQFVIGSTQLF